MKKAFILFTRLPIEGQTKTRLEKAISKQGCVKLHIAMLTDIGNTMKDIDADIFVFYTPNGDLKLVKSIFNDVKGYYVQEGEDIWIRMRNCFKKVFELGYESAVLIGADIPIISSQHVNESFNSLVKSDVVITPTEDLGYCLIGMRKLTDDLFKPENIIDSRGVFTSTVDIALEKNLSIFINKKLLDLDEEDDVIKLVNSDEYDKSVCINTIEYLKKLGY